MGKREAFWRELQLGANEDVVWPESQPERERLARDIFGATVIGAVEAVLEERLAVVNGTPPKVGRDDYEAEVARRALFDSLSEAQRIEVQRELKRACFGSLYWILVKLDHYPSGELDFTVTPYQGDTELPPCGIRELELYAHYPDWVERFSDYGDET